jgi:hypothetical protein
MTSFIKPHMREALKDHVLKRISSGEAGEIFELSRPGTRSYGVVIGFLAYGRMFLTGDIMFGGAGRHGKRNGIFSDLGYGLEWFLLNNADESYYCSKFFSKEFHKEHFLKQLPHYLADYVDQYKDAASKPDCTGCGTEGYVKVDGQDVECSVCKGEGYVDFPENLFANPEENFEELMGRLRDARKGDGAEAATLECQIKLLHLAIAGEHGLDLENPESVYDWWFKFVNDYDVAPGNGYPPGEAGFLCAIREKFREVYPALKSAEENMNGTADRTV